MKRSLAAVFFAVLIIASGLLIAGSYRSDETRAETIFTGKVLDEKTKDPVHAQLWIYDDNYVRSYYGETDRSGVYEIDVERGGTYYIYVQAEGYSPAYTQERIQNGETKVVNFNLTPYESSVFGLVFDEISEEPVDGGYVELYPEDEGGSYYWDFIQENGTYVFHIKPGNYSLLVSVSNYEAYLSDVFFVADGEDREMNIPLRLIPQGIKGVVQNEDGDPIEGASVVIENDHGSYHDATDENGEYEIRAPRGRYDLSVRAGEYRPYKDDVRIPEDEVIVKDVTLKEARALNLLQRIIRQIWALIGGL